MPLFRETPRSMAAYSGQLRPMGTFEPSQGPAVYGAGPKATMVRYYCVLRQKATET